jgi:hypothetical protein
MSVSQCWSEQCGEVIILDPTRGSNSDPLTRQDRSQALYDFATAVVALCYFDVKSHYVWEQGLPLSPSVLATGGDRTHLGLWLTSLEHWPSF